MNRFKCNFITGGAVIAAMAVAAPTLAQDQSTSRQQQQSSRTETSMQGSKAQQGRQDEQDMAPAIVIGELVETRDVNIKGMPGVKHRLLKVRPRQGDTVVIDIGQAKASTTANLQNGDRVIAVGRAGRINDRPVLFARNVGEIYNAGVGESKTAANPARTRSSSASDRG